MSAAGGAIKAQPWNDPHAKPYVQVDHITKSFGDFKAVDEVSLKIYKGEIFCLLVASGCGKTTLSLEPKHTAPVKPSRLARPFGAIPSMGPTPASRRTSRDLSNRASWPI